MIWQLRQQATGIIDIGPGAGDEGGQIVTAGSPEQVRGNRKAPGCSCFEDVPPISKCCRAIKDHFGRTGMTVPGASRKAWLAPTERRYQPLGANSSKRPDTIRTEISSRSARHGSQAARSFKRGLSGRLGSRAHSQHYLRDGVATTLWSPTDLSGDRPRGLVLVSQTRDGGS